MMHQERRQHERRSANFYIELRLEGDVSVRQVELRDISDGGMSFTAACLKDYQKKSHVEVRLPKQHNVTSCDQTLQAEIVWLQEQDPLNPKPWVGLRLLHEA